MVSSSATSKPYDTIVIGLGSAGVTAATTLVKAGRRVLGLEAQGRIGGRVNTVPFGDGVIELGAEWIHGSEDNCVFALAERHNISTVVEDMAIAMYSSDEEKLDSALINEILMQALGFTKQLPEEPEPLGTFYERKLREYVAVNHPHLLKDEDFMTELMVFTNLVVNNGTATNDWTDVSTAMAYKTLEGPHLISWHLYGYKTFFDIMLNKHNNGPGLPNLDIKLGTEVTLITAPQHPGEKTVVTCRDGSEYTADSVIVTVSLGVLKAKYLTLFSPPLPKDKQTAIEKISMGVMDKVILSFDEPWWPYDTYFMGFLWKAEDKKRIAEEDYWVTRIYGASRPMGSGNTLTLWTSGDVGKEVETLPEGLVIKKCVELLQRFVGDELKITIPQPSAMIRSTWYTNPFTRGSYTYDNIDTPKYPDARKWLAAPLTDAAGQPRVLFAGEATNLTRFSTVHGASETGLREAMRLLGRGGLF